MTFNVILFDHKYTCLKGNRIIALFLITGRCDGILANFLACFTTDGIFDDTFIIFFCQSGDFHSKSRIFFSVFLAFILRFYGNFCRSNCQFAVMPLKGIIALLGCTCLPVKLDIIRAFTDLSLRANGLNRKSLSVDQSFYSAFRVCKRLPIVWLSSTAGVNLQGCRCDLDRSVRGLDGSMELSGIICRK